MEQVKNKNTFLIACVSSIVLILTFCYLGINLSWKSTYSAGTAYCLDGSTPRAFNGGYICLNDQYIISISADQKSLTCAYASESSSCLSGFTQVAASVGADGKPVYNCAKTITTVDNFCVSDALYKEEEKLTLTEKTGLVYNGNPQYANTATGSSNGSTNLYYTDSSCSVKFNSGTGSFAPVDAGNYYVQAVDMVSNLMSACVPHKIAPKPLTINWGTLSFLYNGNPQGPSPTVDTGVTGETMTLSATKNTIVGKHTSTAMCISVTGGRGICGNYLLTNTYSPFEITAEPVSYKAVFHDNGGTVSNAGLDSCTLAASATSCDITDVRTLTKSGYKFTGWSEDKDSCNNLQKSKLTLSKASTDFYACFQKNSTSYDDDDDEPITNTYYATFDENTGTFVGSNKKLSCSTTGYSCSISGLPSATKSGYTFMGWGTSSNCTSGDTSSVTLSKNTTFYACYVMDEVTTPPPSDSGNVTTNPGTGDVVIAAIIFLGLLAIGYSFYYFNEIKKK